jgi:tetratricopeptide (TPR) repeat protein
MVTNRADTRSFTARRPRLLWQAPIFVLGLAALAVVCVVRPPWRSVEAERAQRQLAAARQLLRQPDAGRAQLQTMLERLEESLPRLSGQTGEVHFLLGSGYLRLAGTGAAARDTLTRACRHLEEAHALGVPERDQVRLSYQLGKAWFLTDADPRVVIEALTPAVDKGADDPFEGYGMLAQAYLRLPVPDVPGALRATEKQLALSLDDEPRLAPVRLLRGELLLRQGKTEEALHVLGNIGGSAPPDVLARARFLRGRSLQQEERWEEAAAVWKEALEDRRVAPREPGWTLYYLGVCHRRLEQRDEALRAWTLCAGRADAGEEGVAAALGLAELRMQEHSAAALEAFERALRDVNGPADWKNSLVDLGRVRALFEQGCAAYREAGDCERSLQLARLYEKIALPGVAAFLRGAAAAAGARQRQGDEAKALFGQAGEAFEQAAAQASDPAELQERLWRAAECYRLGGDPERTVRTLDRFLKEERSTARLGEGWYHLAEALRERKDLKAASVAYRECIKHATPFAYRAFYQLALIDLAGGNVDNAVAVLRQNLSMLADRPDAEGDAEAEEKSLYTLAGLLFQRRGRENYREAALRLERALRKYPDSPLAVRGRLQLAACHSLTADEEWRESLPDQRNDEARQTFNQQYRSKKIQAAREFEEVVNLLKKRPAEALTPEEQRYLRQALTAGADAWFLGGQYENAIKLYEQLASCDAGRLAEVFALQRILLIRRSLFQKAQEDGKPEVARRELEQARETLRRFRDALLALDDKAFEGEASTRKNYEEALRGYEDWLSAPAR